MPYKDAAKARVWNLEYQRRRQRLARGEEINIEQSVIELVAKNPGTTLLGLYYLLEGKVCFSELSRVVGSLVSGEYGGLLEARRPPRGQDLYASRDYQLYLRQLPQAPAVASDQQHQGA